MNLNLPVIFTYVKDIRSGDVNLCFNCAVKKANEGINVKANTLEINDIYDPSPVCEECDKYL